MNEIEQSAADEAPQQVFALKKTIVMVGMMGAGKTAVGRGLAHLLGVPFRDSDHEIELAANMTVPEIFARDGEPFFRQREAEVIARLMKGPACVLSTGGGAFLNAGVRETIDAHGVALWLDASLDTLWDRVKHKDTRPLLRTANPRQTLSEIFDARRPIYSLARLRTDIAPHRSIDETTDQVLRTLAHAPDILDTPA